MQTIKTFNCILLQRHHILLQRYHILLQGVISDISVKAVTRNQAFLIPQGLFCNTCLFLRATQGKNLTPDIVNFAFASTLFYLIALKSPWDTFALLFDLFYVFLRLALLSVVNMAFFLVVRELLKVFGPSHFLQIAHPKGSSPKICVLF